MCTLTRFARRIYIRNIRSILFYTILKYKYEERKRESEKNVEERKISTWIEAFELEIQVHRVLLCILIALISVSRGWRKTLEAKSRHVDRSGGWFIGWKWFLMAINGDHRSRPLDGLKAVETLKFSRPILVVTRRRIQPYAHARTPWEASREQACRSGVQESFPSRSKLAEIGCTHNAIVRCRIRYNGDGIINETSVTNLGQGVAMGFLFVDRHLHLLLRWNVGIRFPFSSLCVNLDI